LIDKFFKRDPESEHRSAKPPKNRPFVELPPENGRTNETLLLAQAHRVFDRYNSSKIQFLYEELPPRKKIVFNLVPLLLHLQSDELLCCGDACRMSPHGVFGYEFNQDTAQHFTEAFPGQSLPAIRTVSSYDVTLPIKTVCLIGSLGSVAQNTKSDFDYWTGYEAESFSRESFLYFREKLRGIEKWADEFAGAEVHFFPMDLKKIRVDDFGEATGESSGSAQGKLLKEEFYRTMTLIAGQAPLWWVMPPGVSDEEYARLATLVDDSNRVDSTRLVDMGNVHEISLGEFYGAAIWQINKTMGSPFKSVLKMALLEEYMLNHGSTGLLCNEMKQRLLSNEHEAQLLDPYVLMFDRAGAYLADRNRLEDLELLRASLYLKSGVSLSLSDYRRTDLHRKKRVMVNLVRQWGWNHKVVSHLNDYHNWSFRESQKFSQAINGFIVRTYKQISAQLNQQKDQVDLHISKRDLTVLGRKLFIFYSRRTNKVESNKNVIEEPPALNGVTLQPHISRDDQRIWAAYRALLSREAVAGGAGASTLIKHGVYLDEILIWLVTNQLYADKTSINLNAGDGRLVTYATVPDLQKLLRQLQGFFPPVKYSEIDEGELLEKPRLTRMFLTVNLEEPENTTQIVKTGMCYQNNWGEVFFKGYEQSEEGLIVARNFVRKHFAYDPLGALANFKIFLPDRHFTKQLGPRINKFFGIKVYNP
jgi:adenylate cyclase class 1